MCARFSNATTRKRATAYVTLDRAPEITPLGEIGVKLRFENNVDTHENSPYNISLRWIPPEGFTAEGGKRALRIPQRSSHDRLPHVELEVTVRAGERVEAVNRVVLEVLFDGRPTAMYIPVVLLG